MFIYLCIDLCLLLLHHQKVLQLSISTAAAAAAAGRFAQRCWSKIVAHISLVSIVLFAKHGATRGVGRFR